jgi:hypothetical protein
LTATPAEERLEEIAEPGAAELKLNATAIAAAEGVTSPAPAALSPARRRLEATARLVPIGAKLIVFLALLGVAQDFVRFIDLLKLFLRAFLVLCDVGMVLAREFAERALDFIRARRLRDTERLVVISELNSHRREEFLRMDRDVQPTFRPPLQSL